MNYYVLISQCNGEEIIEGLYQAETENDVWNYLHETELEPTNDPVKAEKDRETYYMRHSLLEVRLTVVV